MELIRKACIPPHVHNNPLIHMGCNVQGKNSFPSIVPYGKIKIGWGGDNNSRPGAYSRHKYDLLIYEICKYRVDIIHYMCGVNIDNPYYALKVPGIIPCEF